MNVNVSNDTSSNGGSIPQTNSAFSAATQGSTVLQPLAGTLPLAKVFFPNELLDLENEYDPSTSTFTAKNSGVYLFITSLNFFPDPIEVPYQVRVQILVNGSSVGTEDEFTRGDSGDFTLVILLSAKVNLNAGDTVEVFASSTTPGVLLPGKATRFEGARFPSPAA
ncbi:complement C1q domain-containing protein [Peribacillus simplex]|uniref:complement C1q domain-containing protein n=1 Tax=Peribacillus simplex TaxID=1478 RepID=UPI00203C0463|nr:complement C1q domain-containing protein [Peribacillus simplex]MCM3673070.1 complement C1q domain-containing protein [Peribacillus simplex]